VRAIQNVGEIEVLGEKVNTKTLITDLKRAGGLCGTIGNMLERFSENQDEVVEFGNAASEISNWKDIVGSINKA
jgi:hypothetical protein